MKLYFLILLVSLLSLFQGLRANATFSQLNQYAGIYLYPEANTRVKVNHLTHDLQAYETTFDKARGEALYQMQKATRLAKSTVNNKIIGPGATGFIDVTYQVEKGTTYALKNVLRGYGEYNRRKFAEEILNSNLKIYNQINNFISLNTVRYIADESSSLDGHFQLDKVLDVIEEIGSSIKKAQKYVYNKAKEFFNIINPFNWFKENPYDEVVDKTSKNLSKKYKKITADLITKHSKSTQENKALVDEVDQLNQNPENNNETSDNKETTASDNKQQLASIYKHKDSIFTSITKIIRSKSFVNIYKLIRDIALALLVVLFSIKVLATLFSPAIEQELGLILLKFMCIMIALAYSYDLGLFIIELFVNLNLQLIQIAQTNITVTQVDQIADNTVFAWNDLLNNYGYFPSVLLSFLGSLAGVLFTFSVIGLILFITIGFLFMPLWLTLCISEKSSLIALSSFIKWLKCNLCLCFLPLVYLILIMVTNNLEFTDFNYLRVMMNISSMLLMPVIPSFLFVDRNLSYLQNLNFGFRTLIDSNLELQREIRSLKFQ
jgi:hypothetical protein